ncbi:MAG: M56 family metallopeptidase [Acidobacteriota bacterium]|nr:M56 family metallopeptidase [Acidobacteriota bacterium]
MISLDLLLPLALKASLKAALIALVVALVLRLLGRHLSPGVRYGLWLLVPARLALPVAPVSEWSLFRGEAFAGLQTGGQAGGWIPGLGDLPEAIGAVVAASPASGWSFDGRLTLLALWGAGALLHLSWLAVGEVRLHRLVAAAPALADERALRLLRECRHRLGIRQQVELRSVDGGSSSQGPGIFGWLRPKVLLPQSLVRHLDDVQLRHLLLHELTHLRRLDGPVRRLASLLMALHWFNPAAHWALRRMAAECELACDAQVLKLLDAGERRAYGHTLLSLSVPSSYPTALPAFSRTSKRELKRRITMIARFQPPSLRSAALGLTIFAVLAFATLTDLPAQAGTAESPGTDAGAEDIEKQKQTIENVRTVGTAMFAWLTDQDNALTEAQDPPDGKLSWARCKAVTAEELEELLVPAYLQELPTEDGWGHPLEYCIDEQATYMVIALRSPGRDGTYEDTTYSIGAFLPPEVDHDVVWSDGFFVRWPGKPGG